MVTGRPAGDSLIGQLEAKLGGAVFELWEDNVTAVKIFDDMMTQWHHGPAGPAGLRYEALPVVMNLRHVPAARRAEVFDAVQTMERAALEVFRG